jgi:glutaminase
LFIASQSGLEKDMSDAHTSMLQTEAGLISTGALPRGEDVRALVEIAYVRFRFECHVADYIPAMAKTEPSLFGICIANTRGDKFAVGDADRAFSIQSVSKPFVFALVCDAIGAARRRAASVSTPRDCRSTP